MTTLKSGARRRMIAAMILAGLVAVIAVPITSHAAYSSKARSAAPALHAVQPGRSMGRHQVQIGDPPAPLPPLFNGITYPPGIPAIQPRKTGVDVTSAAYTADDVRQYLLTHQLFQTADGVAPVIAQILFIPANQASGLMHDAYVERAPTTLVCYVKIQGNLSTTGVGHPYVPGASNTTPPPAHVGDLVFDAQTGNLLVRGFDA